MAWLLLPMTTAYKAAKRPQIQALLSLCCESSNRIILSFLLIQEEIAFSNHDLHYKIEKSMTENDLTAEPATTILLACFAYLFFYLHRSNILQFGSINRRRIQATYPFCPSLYLQIGLYTKLATRSWFSEHIKSAPLPSPALQRTSKMNQTSYREIALPLEGQRQLSADDSWNAHRFQYDDILQQPSWDDQRRPNDFLGHDNNRLQQSWVFKEQSYPSVNDEFPAGVGLGSHSTASFSLHQDWDGMSARMQTVSRDPGQGVVSLETASPSPGTADPIQCGSNMSKIFDGYVRRRFGNETTQKIAENWGISPECVFYLFPVIDVRGGYVPGTSHQGPPRTLPSEHL
ncbi:hypothetical protein IW261DRAFT_1418490 [Armillaria novae-zelandiae]|uniref:Uncharacterized protein n=1 Tax=Armillaria novae-zelandiae TaxID=153914 RepID=A0AA39PCS2_9AGAR|nr:hypothetical protein IW261DRAFT_1418490 [Armillaria novae-zelandiae]